MKTNGKSQVEVPGASPGFSFLGWIMIIRIFFGSRCSRHRLWIGVLSGGFAEPRRVICRSRPGRPSTRRLDARSLHRPRQRLVLSDLHPPKQYRRW